MKILIDDDKLIQTSWSLKAAAKETSLKCFFTVDSFLVAAIPPNLVDTLYIDSDLKLERKGEDFAKNLYDMGYKNIYLVTSYQDLELKNFPWLKGILTKRAPF